MSENDLIEEALARLEQESPPAATAPDGQQQPDGEQQPANLPLSPTLAALEPSRRPIAGTVCEHCPNSMWFASPVEVKCYCRVMYMITWSSKEPNELTLCGGPQMLEQQ